MLHQVRLATVCFLLLLLSGTAGAQQLIINEFSQGVSGVQEYIELVVVGHHTCAGDSCADIRGWIIDDNNGWCGAGPGQGIATGHMRFSNDATWSCVPYGSIILLYNGGDVNPSITLAPDPADANGDHVYVVPSTSNLLENTSATPVSPSSTTYVYPAGAYAAGGSWSTVGLANGGDAVIITSTANFGAAEHSIAYGSVSGGATATVYKSQSGTAKVYSLNDDQFTVAASYIVGNAPTDETPGLPNSPANAAWIADMLTNTSGVIHVSIAACMLAGGSYDFNGTLLTAAGSYEDTLTSASGCDSIISLNLVQVNPFNTNSTMQGCNAVVFNGITYTSSTIVNDTLFSDLGCDSVYRQTIIQIQPIVPTAEQDTVHGCQSIVYKGIAYNSSQTIADTVKTATGCDSIYRAVYLDIRPIPTITVSPSDTLVCSGTPVTLTATSIYPVRWNGYPAGNTIVVSPEASTTYRAETSDDLNCIGVAFATVQVEDFRLALNYAPRPAEQGEQVVISTSANTGYTVLGWEPAAVFGSPNTAKQVSLTADKPFTIIVAGKSDNNCIDTARIVLEVAPVPYVFLPTAFTPNGDGVNDFFTPSFIRDFKIADFSVFNRWGQRVYNAHSNVQLERGWDGRFNGQACDLGTYYYRLSAQNARGEMVTMKGDVLLAR